MNVGARIFLIRDLKGIARWLKKHGEFHARAHFEDLVDRLERELLAYVEK